MACRSKYFGQIAPHRPSHLPNLFLRIVERQCGEINKILSDHLEAKITRNEFNEIFIVIICCYLHDIYTQTLLITSEI